MSPRFIPKDEKFFDLFVAHGENTLAAAQELEAMVTAYDDLEARVGRIRDLEHQGDEIDNELVARLERAFITPFDREDIHALTSRIDDVVDGIQEAAELCIIYDIDTLTDETRQLVSILVAQSTQLLEALRKLESQKDLEPHLKEIHSLENQADRLYRAATAKLFKGDDAIRILKFRDLYRSLEETIDAAEDAAEVIERVLHKGA